MELTSAGEKRLKAIIAEEAEKLGVKESEVLPYYKSTAHPNTYGVINMKYEEKSPVIRFQSGFRDFQR